jgi:hypothetical protein
LQEVNTGLTEGRYFFMDIARDGIALYEAEGSELAEPQPQTPDHALAMAKEYFEEWLPSAQEFLDDYCSNMTRRRYKKAAFELHQAAERYYHCVLLVCTFYTPHGHSLRLPAPCRACR